MHERMWYTTRHNSLRGFLCETPKEENSKNYDEPRLILGNVLNLGNFVWPPTIDKPGVDTLQLLHNVRHHLQERHIPGVT